MKIAGVAILLVVYVWTVSCSNEYDSVAWTYIGGKKGHCRPIYGSDVVGDGAETTLEAYMKMKEFGTNERPLPKTDHRRFGWWFYLGAAPVLVGVLYLYPGAIFGPVFGWGNQALKQHPLHGIQNAKPTCPSPPIEQVLELIKMFQRDPRVRKLVAATEVEFGTKLAQVARDASTYQEKFFAVLSGTNIDRELIMERLDVYLLEGRSAADILQKLKANPGAVASFILDAQPLELVQEILLTRYELKKMLAFAREEDQPFSTNMLLAGADGGVLNELLAKIVSLGALFKEPKQLSPVQESEVLAFIKNHVLVSSNLEALIEKAQNAPTSDTIIKYLFGKEDFKQALGADLRLESLAGELLFYALANNHVIELMEEYFTQCQLLK